MRLGDVAPGSVKRIGEIEFIILSQSFEETGVITKEFQTEMTYGETGSYLESNVRTWCNRNFYQMLAQRIGPENILLHHVDLQAEDGTGIDKSCEDYVSLLTKSRYRRYRQYLPAYGRWWWLSTRVSYDDSLGYSRYACCVNSDGIPYWFDCDFRNGVRPFLTLKSDLLIS